MLAIIRLWRLSSSPGTESVLAYLSSYVKSLFIAPQ